MRESCKRGHPLRGENLYISPTGVRGCKTCRKSQHAQYRNSATGKKACKSRDLREVNWTLERFEVARKIQNNECAICELPFTEDRTPRADHDHIKGDPRGLLCDDCNLGLGRFKDSPYVLERAIRYLKKWMV